MNREARRSREQRELNRGDLSQGKGRKRNDRNQGEGRKWNNLSQGGGDGRKGQGMGRKGGSGMVRGRREEGAK